MAGIFRHFIIACLLSAVIFVLFYNRISPFSLLFFILGNILPDMVFIPAFVVKHKTLNPEKIINTRAWKVLARWDELVMFIISAVFLLIIPSLKFSMLAIGVLIHVFIDKYMIEENVWW